MLNAILISYGAIAQGLKASLNNKYHNINIKVISSQTNDQTDFLTDYTESSLKNIARNIHDINLVFVSCGVLHDKNVKPEKSIRDLNSDNLSYYYQINTIIPALCAKYFLPKMHKTNARFIVLSARVGSITDNKLGGWYGYRMSKTALNMLIKNLSIEYNRINKHIIISSIHPGTVDSKLSAPFNKNIKHKIFTKIEAGNNILNVIEKLTINDTGKCFDFKYQEIEA